MYDLPLNSAIIHENLPFQEKQYLADMPVKDFAKIIESFRPTKKPHPETDVLKFYFLNHAFHAITTKYGNLSLLPQELADVLDIRAKTIPSICSRVLSHTFLTLLYEMNWLHRSVDKSDAFYRDMESRFGSDLANHVTQGGSGGFSLGKMANYKNLNVNCGDYTRAIFNTYTSSPHFSAIAKDKQWINIAAIPYEFFLGHTSLEGSTDKAFSLFHWGGSIFNKNILYHVNTDEMMHFLDIQDSGQIPQWIDKNINSEFIDTELKKAFLLFKDYFAEEVNKPIDKTSIEKARNSRSQKLNTIIAQRGKNNTTNQNNDKTEKLKPVPKIDKILQDTLTNLYPPKFS